MNKNTKIWLNYLLGGVICLALLWALYLQVIKQVQHIDRYALLQTGASWFLWAGILLMPVNLLLEAWKWKLLAGSAYPLSFKDAFLSYLAGIAFSIITPNRIGEYPGRILYLGRKNTFRLISVSIFGGMAQMLSLFIFGLAGLVYYNARYPGYLQKAMLACCIPATVIVAVIYWRFETWLPLLQKIRWLKKYNVLGQLLMRFSGREQINILVISLARFGVFTAQYLFLLRWMNVNVPLAGGFCLSAMFFWVIAIVPSIAIAEVGERAWASIYVFQYIVPANPVGVISATMEIWCINLIIPALIGGLLIFRIRFLRGIDIE